MMRSQFILGVLIFFCACSAKRATQNPTSFPTTIASICKNLEGYRDQQVTIEGRFMGWRADFSRIPAVASKAITRSDWLFSDGSESLYVTAGRPEDLDPFDTEQIGRRMHLRATVRLTDEGKVYLEFISGRALR
jgi:hypothetical protein